MSAPDPSPFYQALARALLTGTAAMARDLQEMAEGRYTGRHSQAWLDGGQERAWLDTAGEQGR